MNAITDCVWKICQSNNTLSKIFISLLLMSHTLMCSTVSSRDCCSSLHCSTSGSSLTVCLLFYAFFYGIVFYAMLCPQMSYHQWRWKFPQLVRLATWNIARAQRTLTLRRIVLLFNKVHPDWARLLVAHSLCVNFQIFHPMVRYYRYCNFCCSPQYCSQKRKQPLNLARWDLVDLIDRRSMQRKQTEENGDV